MNIYRYYVEYYIETISNIETESGYTFGYSYREVVEKISNYYGEKNIETLKIKFVSDNEVLRIPNQHYFNMDDIDKANELI